MSEIATATVFRPVNTRAAAPNLPLVEYFQRFYERVVRLKRALASAQEGTYVEHAEIAQQELLAALRQQTSDAQGQFGAAAIDTLEHAHYVMAALADETFIHSQWAGSELWRDQLLLEGALFGTSRAGDDIFRRSDQVITGRIANAYELATIYLMTLGLGFEGKYRRAPQGHDKLELHRSRLLAFLTHLRPELDDPRRHLSPGAYRHTAGDSEPPEIPTPGRWLFGLVFILLAWPLISHWIWLDLIADLKPILDQILAP